MDTRATITSKTTSGFPNNWIRVLTLNCCLIPKGIYQSNANDRREDRLEAITKLVSRYDIVLLQEVFGSSWCSQWRDKISAVPDMHCSLTNHRDRLVDSGLVVLSKKKISYSSYTPFKSVSIVNKMVVERGFLYCFIEPNIHVLNMHLNPSECHVGNKPASQFRREEIEQVLEFKNKIGKADDFWIIGGDFNDDSLVQEMFAGYNISFEKEKVNTCNNDVDYALTGSSEMCIDYIVSNRPFRYTLLNKTKLSDHYGVEVGINL